MSSRCLSRGVYAVVIAAGIACSWLKRRGEDKKEERAAEASRDGFSWLDDLCMQQWCNNKVCMCLYKVVCGYAPFCSPKLCLLYNSLQNLKSSMGFTW